MSEASRNAAVTWARRLGIVLLLVVAVGVLVKGGQRAETDGTAGDRDPTIVSQFPLPGGNALRQTEIGAMLRAGYDGRLTINGVAIPEDQMEGAIDPQSVSVEQLRRYGIRPNNRNSVYFKPGPGKVLTKLPTGEITVTVRYFKDRQNQSDGRAVSWTFMVD